MPEGWKGNGSMLGLKVWLFEFHFELNLKNWAIGFGANIYGSTFHILPLTFYVWFTPDLDWRSKPEFFRY